MFNVTINLSNISLFSFQPLMDNLESQTYETFEKDAVKYIQVLLQSNFFLFVTSFQFIRLCVVHTILASHDFLFMLLFDFLFSLIRGLRSYQVMI